MARYRSEPLPITIFDFATEGSLAVMFYLPVCCRLSERTVSGFITCENKNVIANPQPVCVTPRPIQPPLVCEDELYCGKDEWRRQVRFIFGSSSIKVGKNAGKRAVPNIRVKTGSASVCAAYANPHLRVLFIEDGGRACTYRVILTVPKPVFE